MLNFISAEEEAAIVHFLDHGEPANVWRQSTFNGRHGGKSWGTKFVVDGWQKRRGAMAPVDGSGVDMVRVDEFARETDDAHEDLWAVVVAVGAVVVFGFCARPFSLHFV